MNRLQLVAMIVAALSVMALLLVTAQRERQTRLMLYVLTAILLTGGGAFVLATQPWYSEHWGYFNVISGVYFLLLAVAPLWALINLVRARR